jgi:hypothetical protein
VVIGNSMPMEETSDVIIGPSIMVAARIGKEAAK